MYSKITLHGAYDFVRIWKGDEWRTKFCTYYGHFEYVVMPFGFTNASIVFQHFMNDDFREYLNGCVVCYIDDILICSKFFEKQEQHV
jgi:hypothetical protein